MGRLLVTLATLLVFLLGAAFVAPAFVDWKSYRLDVEQAASALLGRKITIVGDIDIALLPEPHLHAKKVIAEGGPSEAAQMTAEAVDLTLSLQGLLSGRIETSKLKFLNPFLILDLSKPLQSGSAPREGRALSIAAEVTSLEIEGGRISVYPDAGKPEALTLTGVDGTLAAPQQRGNPYRFTGRVSQKNQRYDVKFAAAAHGGGVKLAGSAIELQSKAAIQADGVLTMSDAPVFDGTLAATAPQALVGAPFDIQAKGGAKLNSAGLALSDLVLTMDPGNRPQILTGSASVAFAPGTADISLQARSLDADVLLSGGAGSGAPGAPVGWDTFQTALVQLLWFYPEFGVHLSLASDQIQLRGELIEGAKAEGQRAAQRWLFEDARATLPGETSMRLTGALKKTAGKPELMARVAVDGKNLGRLNRWIAPPAANAKTAPARVFTAGGLLTLSDDITAFTDVKGKLDGTPFTASLRLDKTPARKLKVSLAGDSFDLTSLEAGQTGADALSGESIKAAWQAGLAQLAPLLGDDAANFETADIDVSAGSLRTSLIEAKNVAVQLKYDQDLLTVTKLSAETADGLSLRGEGVVPMRSVGQGRFDGRLEANSPQAVLRAVALAGYNADSIAGRRAEDLAPVKLAMNYSADGQASGATAQLSGTLGAVRLDGRVQLKGALAEWRAGQFSGQLALSGADGNKLIALLFPKAGLAAAASASPGAITIRASGAPDRLDTSATIKAPSLQAQIDGATEFKETFFFSGKVQASSPAPEQFLPPAALALLGGERQTSLKVETNIEYGSGHLDAAKLKAESPKNVVSGHLAIGAADRLTEVDADLKADQFSLPSILGYLVAPPPSDRVTLALSNVIPAQSEDVWSDRPFALNVFRDTAAKVALSAKTIKLTDTLALSDAQIAATLGDGRLAVQKLEGKALGGDMSASVSLDGRASAVAASAIVSLSKADLPALAANGSPAMATGKAWLSLRATGQGLSPRGIISVLTGRGSIALSDGQLAKFSPVGVQKGAEELLAGQLPLTEDAIKKKALDAVQAADFKFHHLKIPLTIHDGTLEVRRASFRGRDSTVRMEAYLDLSKMQADTTWQAGVSSDKRMKWPLVKVQISGPLRELGGRPRVLAAEDFVRAVLVRKMEGDITRLESLNKPQTGAASWATKQEPVPPAPARRRRDDPAVQAGAVSNGGGDFERRMRDTLSKSTPRPDSQW